MDIQALIAKAETSEDWAEICRLEAEQCGGPFWCQSCGAELSDADTLPCRQDYPDYKCGADRE